MSKYTAEEIRTIDELIDHIRENIGMYIGESSTPIHLFEECFTNSIDEAIARYCDQISIEVDTENNFYHIKDNGRGIPIDNDVPIQISTKFSGAKFQGSKTAYDLVSGKHGVGLVVVNALSLKYEIEIYRDKQYALFEFENGKLINRVVKKHNKKNKPFSTRVSFIPDPEFFDSEVISVEDIRNRCLTASVELSHCDIGLTVDNSETEHISYDKLDYFNNYCVNSDDNIGDIINIQSTDKNESFEVICSWSESGPITPKILSSVNVLPVEDGGTHLNIISEIIKEVITEKAKKSNYRFQPSDCLVRLRAYISLYLVHPVFGAQSKDKLTNRKSYFNVLRKKLKRALENYFNNNPEFFNNLLAQFDSYRRSLDSKKLRANASSGRASTKLTKLKDCQRRDGELLICEGDSACFTGDSELFDINLNRLSFNYIYNNLNGDNVYYTFSCDKYGKIYPTRIIDCFITKYVNKLVKIVLDNDEVIKCTLDHRFMLRNGTYKQAQFLTYDDSLMPLYYKTSKKYNMVKCNNSNKFEYIFHISSTHKDSEDDMYSLEEDIINIHHIDKNPNNDYPNNLMRMGQNKHLNVHKEDNTLSKEERTRIAKKAANSLHEKRINDKEYDENYRKNLKSAFSDPDFKRNHSEVHKVSMNKPEVKEKLREKANAQWSNEENRRKKSEEVKEFYRNNPDRLQEKRLALMRGRCKYWHNKHPEDCDKCREKYLELKNNNHKIKSIEFIDVDNEPMYDITVDSDDHNFPLSGGIFVHNSGTVINMRDPGIHAVLPLKGKIPSVVNKKEDIIKNQEISDLISAVGTGYGPEFDISKIRYNRIIIFTDADSVSAETLIYYIDENGFIQCNQIKDMKGISDNCYIESYNLNGNKELKKIKQVIPHKYNKDIIWRLNLVSGTYEDFTDDHVIYVWNKEKNAVQEKSPTSIDTNNDYLIVPNKRLTVEKEIELDITDNIINVLNEENQSYVLLNISEFNWDTKEARIDISKRIDFSNYTKEKLAELIGINRSTLQMYDYGRDNTFAPVEVIEKMQNYVNIDLTNTEVKVKLNESTKEYVEKGIITSQTDNKCRNIVKIDENLAYLIGQYIGDGNYGCSRKNPYEVQFNTGPGKFNDYLINSFKQLGYKNYVIDKKHNNNIVNLKSIEFVAILDRLGLTRDRYHKYKFIPLELFSAKENIRKALLKGLYHSDGTLFKNENGYRFSYTTSSDQLKDDVYFLLRQFGTTPTISKRKPGEGGLNHKYEQIISSKTTYQININKLNDLYLLSDVFDDNYININQKEIGNWRMIPISEDFSAIKINSIEEKPYNYNEVYDLEVEDNHNFPVGSCGCIAHNSDGGHIASLLMVMFAVLTPGIIQNGYLYLVRTPLRAINDPKKGEFTPLWTKEEYDKAVKKKRPITYFKGLGELNPWQLEECALNPENRSLIQVTMPNNVNNIISYFSNVEKKRQLLNDENIGFFNY